jgi:hypothetical protein
MKKVAVFFAALGFASGFLFALGPFLFRPLTNSVGSYVLPVITGLLLVGTHKLNWKRLHNPAQSYPRGRLIAFNLVLLVIQLIGFTVMYRVGVRFHNETWRQVSFLLLWPLPLAVNAAYLLSPAATR